MAKKKVYRRKRRRVGAMSLNPSSPVVKAVAAGGGFMVADTINTAIDKVLPASLTAATGITKYIPAALEVAPAAFLLITGKKVNPILSLAAFVLAGAGVKRGLKQAGVITGFNSIPTIGGFNSIPTIGGVPAQLGASIPAQLNGGFRTRVMNGFRTRNVVGGVSDGSGINANSR
jgi:hypothetical protein